jgi:hypothetical protein
MLRLVPIAATTHPPRKFKGTTGIRLNATDAGFPTNQPRENHMTRGLLTTLFALSIATLTGCESAGPRYRSVRSYSEGLAPVQTANGRWGYVDAQQRWIIQPRFDDAKEFQSGRAAVRQNGKWGFINKRGEWL